MDDPDIVHSDHLEHFGVKGMKWGVRKDRKSKRAKQGVPEPYTKDRVLKKGTTYQNISDRKLTDLNSNRGRIFASYTMRDNILYGDIMGNFQYSEKAYRNTIRVKKDIKIASDQHTVDGILEFARSNPKKFATDMAKARRSVKILPSLRRAGHYEKKLSKITDSESQSAHKLAREFITNVTMSKKTQDSAVKFYGSMVKKGYGAIPDFNDRYNFVKAADPLVIISPSNNSTLESSVRLTKKELNDYYNMNKSGSRMKDRDPDIVHSDHLEHFGVKGMKWGVRKDRSKTSATTGRRFHRQRVDSEDYTRVKPLRKKKPSELSNKEMQDLVYRLNLERQYSQLTKRQPTALEKFARDVTVGVAQQAIIDTARNTVAPYSRNVSSNLNTIASPYLPKIMTTKLQESFE